MKKGFTLLELLAVIIILAVIALITTPIVLNVVDEAKRSAFQDSAYGLIKSGEYYHINQILNGGMTSDKVFNFPNNTELEFSGTEPESGYIKVTKDGLVEIAVSNGKYCATKGLNEEKVTIKDYVEGECTVGSRLQAPTISLNGDILNITPNDDRTEKYEIYVDGELKTTIAAQQAAAATVADGENVIKAGTYRFNDVLAESDIELNADINFTVTVTAYGIYEGTAHCDNITVEATLHNAGMTFEYWYNVMRFNVSELDPAFAYLSTPTQLLIYQTTHLGGGETSGIWETDSLSDGIKTITILNDTEVSAEFYNWFTANATQLTTYDLSSLNLEDGAYEISVKAVAESYEDSNESNVVTYEVATDWPISWNMSELDGATSVSAGGVTFYKVSELTPDISRLSGTTVTGAGFTAGAGRGLATSGVAGVRYIDETFTHQLYIYSVADKNVASAALGATVPETGLYVADYSGTLSGQDFDFTLNDAANIAHTDSITDSWAEIKAHIDSGDYKEHYELGDTKTITMADGTTVVMEIVAFDEDTKEDGTKAAISWMSKRTITIRPMNADGTTTGGWVESDLRSWLRGEFYNELPTEVTNVITSVKKTYYDYGDSVTEICVDNIWIPSYSEIVGGNSPEDSGANYSGYFTNNAARAKVTYGGGAANWWLRTVANTEGFAGVYRDGDCDAFWYYTSDWHSVVIGFCM